MTRRGAESISVILTVPARACAAAIPFQETLANRPVRRRLVCYSAGRSDLQVVKCAVPSAADAVPKWQFNSHLIVMPVRAAGFVSHQ